MSLPWGSDFPQFNVKIQWFKWSFHCNYIHLRKWEWSTEERYAHIRHHIIITSHLTLLPPYPRLVAYLFFVHTVLPDQIQMLTSCVVVRKHLFFTMHFQHIVSSSVTGAYSCLLWLLGRTGIWISCYSFLYHEILKIITVLWKTAMLATEPAAEIMGAKFQCLHLESNTGFMHSNAEFDQNSAFSLRLRTVMKHLHWAAQLQDILDAN
jgi:hypothetical protein